MEKDRALNRASCVEEVGLEFFYCFECGTRIQGGDFRKGQAFWVGNRPACGSCAARALPPAPPPRRRLRLVRPPLPEAVFRGLHPRHRH